ncbi:MAG: 2-hydroxychromene-2-carboxylate isomerase [Afipia sp.]
MPKPVLDFWFDFASVYSFLTATRIAPLADAAGVQVRWRPFLLGPIFATQGMTDSPFNLFPLRGQHMIRDVKRAADEIGVGFKWPDVFPQSAVLASRIALVGLKDTSKKTWGEDFSRAVFHAEYAENRVISEPGVIADILTKLKVPVDATFASAQADEIKTELREQTAEAQRREFFGAPTFTTQDGELFWGNDRLEQALRWATK